MMPGTFRYANPRTIHSGVGSVAALDRESRAHDVSTPLIVTTRSLEGSRALGAVRAASDGLAAAPTVPISAHSPVAELRALLSAVRERETDGLVVLGGGSAIDAAKLVALAARRSSLDVDAFPDAIGRPDAKDRSAALPLLCAPTTLSVAELAASAGFTDTAGEKQGFSDPRMLPAAVVYDPDLTLETPLRLWLSTGVRALDHAVEALFDPEVDPLSETLAIVAVGDLLRGLRRCRNDPSSMDARLGVQLASWKSYLSPTSSGRGWSHALGRAVGARNGIPHGITSCVILPEVVRARGRRGDTTPAIARLAAALGLDAGDPASALADLLRASITDLGLPARFTPQELDPAAVRIAAGVAASRTGAPPEELAAILTTCVGP